MSTSELTNKVWSFHYDEIEKCKLIRIKFGKKALKFVELPNLQLELWIPNGEMMLDVNCRQYAIKRQYTNNIIEIDISEARNKIDDSDAKYKTLYLRIDGLTDAQADELYASVQ